jgi:hypothetical protein
MAISAIKKKIAAAKDEHEMMRIILANRERFDDKDGHPLPFVQELHNYIEEQKTVKEKLSGDPLGEEDPKQKPFTLNPSLGDQDSGKKADKEHGRISEKSEKWFRHILTGKELKQFIEDARNGKNPGNALIGVVSDSTKEEVKKLTGVEVNKIVLEGTSIAHADNPKHHLEDDDIEKCSQVINHPISIKLSSKTNEQGLKIIEFEGNIDGVIYFAEAVHKKYGGWLSLASVYRPEKSKVSGAPMPPDGPPELTPETPRPMPSTPVSPESGEKSSPTPPKTGKLNLDGWPETEEAEAVKKAVAAVLQSIPAPHLIKSFMNLFEDEAV